MKKLFRGRVRLILLLAVLLAAATALTAALSGTAWGSRTVQAVLTPFRSGFSALTRQAERYYNYLFNYESLSAENDYLRRQISSMENEVRTADSLQRENERLKELLGLQEEHEDYRFNEAYIVSWDSSSWKTRSRKSIDSAPRSFISAVSGFTSSGETMRTSMMTW